VRPFFAPKVPKVKPLGCFQGFSEFQFRRIVTPTNATRIRQNKMNSKTKLALIVLAGLALGLAAEEYMAGHNDFYNGN
jgi:hypothetical protein